MNAFLPSRLQIGWLLPLKLQINVGAVSAGEVSLLKNIDIGKYRTLTAYLKSESRGYKVKKAAVLEKAHVETFLTRACDKEYLMIKVALIMGVSGVNLVSNQ